MNLTFHPPFHPPLFKLAIAVGSALFLASCAPKDAEPAPAEAAEAHNETVVTLTPESLRNVDIKTEIAALGTLDRIVKAPARVSENLNKTAKVTSAFEGRLAQLHRDLNDPVKAGDVLALVQTPELLGRPLELKSPIDGIVTERKGTPGELVEKGAAVYVVSDPGELWVIAEVREERIAAVREGLPATFTVPAHPGRVFAGRVARVGNRVESATRTVEVRIVARNDERLLKPGMFAEAQIITGVEEPALLIPASALQADDDGAVVFVALENADKTGANGHDSARQFEKRPVKTGREQNGRVQVLAGIREGETVVAEGGFILKSELLKHELGEE